MPKVKLDQSAFSLVELLVVLSIIAILATIAVPTVVSMTSPKHTLRREGRRLVKILSEARQVAINRKIQVNLRVDVTKGQIIAEESGITYLMIEDHESTVSNKFFKAISFDEEIVLNAFAAEAINNDSDQDIFQPMTSSAVTMVENKPQAEPAIVFSHFGSTDGGGISLIHKGLRLDVVCDVLTGKPRLTRRRDLNEG